MKKIITPLLVVISATLILSSCSSTIPFTQNVRDRYNLSEQDLKRIQFYLSDAVVLKRGEDLAKEKGTDDGTLVVKSGKNLEQIVFKRNTTCAVNSVADNNKLTMGFEEDANKFLVFGSEGDRKGYYTLKALRWNDGKGEIKYGTQTYYSNPGSERTFLMFKMKSLRKISVDEKVVKGKKVK